MARKSGMKQIFRAAVCTVGILLIASAEAFTQQNIRDIEDFSKSAEWFPRIYKPYVMRTIPKFEQIGRASCRERV